MDRLIINGSKKLEGTIKVDGAKNAALPMIAASLLTPEEVIITNFPLVRDTCVMAKLALSIGAKIDFQKNTLNIRSENLTNKDLVSPLAREIRTSFLMAGALLARLHEVSISYPGGCTIGDRKIDLHINGFVELGAKVDINEQYVKMSTDGLSGADMTLNFPSVGATENIMIAACLADGYTTIRNAAKEPEIVDLSRFLNSMGAHIEGAGTDKIKIEGVDRLHGSTYSVMPDRINTGTFIVASAITGSNLSILGTTREYINSFILVLSKMGIETSFTNHVIKVASAEMLMPIDIVTDVYPGFATDLHPIIAPLLALADGESRIKETIFGKRFNYVNEFKKMGANIEVEGNTVIINGIKSFKGDRVIAHDLRAGAALVLAGLSAKGTTIIENVHQIDRGYRKIDATLHEVGADIKRVNNNDAATYNISHNPF